MTILERISALLHKQKMTVRELANRTGVKENTITTWKRRGTNPPAECIAPIAAALGVSVQYLLTGEETENKSVPDDDESEILSVFRSLSRREKHEFMVMVYDFENKEESRNSASFPQTFSDQCDAV